MSTFGRLWKNFPDKEIMKESCRNKQPDGSNDPFKDYCSIMLSECFNKSGIIYSAKGNCWSHSDKKHILLAENLATGLKMASPRNFGKLEKIKPATFQNELKNRTGVIFFKDYWQRGTQSFEGRTGDHIDLWNKDKITSSSMFTRSILEFFGRVSDFNKSKEIWFWEVK